MCRASLVGWVVGWCGVVWCGAVWCVVVAVSLSLVLLASYDGCSEKHEADDDPPPPPAPCTHSKRPRVCRHHAHMLKTHVRVVPVHTGFFSVSHTTPHHTPHHNMQQHATTCNNTQQHATTRNNTQQRTTTHTTHNNTQQHTQQQQQQ